MSVIVHTHADLNEGGTLDQTAFVTSDGSYSGSISASTTTGFTFGSTGYVFWPMLWVQANNLILVCHGTDAVDPDAPRMALRNNHATATFSYEIAYRQVDAP